MATKLTRLTHKIAIQLQRAVPFAVLAPGCQSGNFWIHPRIYLYICMRNEKRTKACVI